MCNVETIWGAQRHQRWHGFCWDPSWSTWASNCASLQFRAEAAEISPCSEPGSSLGAPCSILSICHLVGQQHMFQIDPLIGWLSNSICWKCHQRLWCRTCLILSTWCCCAAGWCRLKRWTREGLTFPSPQTPQSAHPAHHSLPRYDFPWKSLSPCSFSLVTWASHYPPKTAAVCDWIQATPIC